MWPNAKLEFNDQGWAYIGDKWIKSDVGTLEVDEDGWVFNHAVSQSFEWPEAWDDPVPGSWNYALRHPTRYTFRPDVNEWAKWLVQHYDVWCNTYLDHPEGYWRDEDSFDVWGPAGRDDPLDPATGDEIFNLLFKSTEKPDIDWIIWKANLYSAANDWKGWPFGVDPFSWHYDHIHVTYRKV